MAPDLHFYGIGGPRMRAAGVETLVDAKVMAVMGLVEVLGHYPTLRAALKLMQRRLAEDRPDLLVLVDYPDFNLRLAKTAKRLGIKVLYYISPQIWAWRQHRVYKIKKLVDMMAVVFPFEEPFYQQAGVPVRFVGHPLAEEVYCSLSAAEAKQRFDLDPGRPVVGLFPGSRRSELKRLLPTLLASAAQLHAQDLRYQFLLPRASSLEEADLAPYLATTSVPIQVVSGHPYEAIRACDAIAAASGTVTLEIGLLGTPLVVVYRVAALSYRIMRRLIKVDHIALCNIVADRRIAPELIQDDATPERISAELSALLTEPARAQAMRSALAEIRERLGGHGASAAVAQLLLEQLALVAQP